MRPDNLSQISKDILSCLYICIFRFPLQTTFVVYKRILKYCQINIFKNIYSILNFI